jgi:hypothetical protein
LAPSKLWIGRQPRPLPEAFNLTEEQRKRLVVQEERVKAR